MTRRTKSPIHLSKKQGLDGRASHSSTVRLNVSAHCGIGGALRDGLGINLPAFRLSGGFEGC